MLYNLELKQRYPIKLIDLEKNKLKLTPEGIRFLEQQHEPFGVLVCLGPYRMGKSYLLNRIIKKKDVFGVGHTDRGETKGVMMYGDFIQVKNDDDDGLKYFVLDTEVCLEVILIYNFRVKIK